MLQMGNVFTCKRWIDSQEKLGSGQLLEGKYHWTGFSIIESRKIVLFFFHYPYNEVQKWKKNNLKSSLGLIDEIGFVILMRFDLNLTWGNLVRLITIGRSLCLTKIGVDFVTWLIPGKKIIPTYLNCRPCEICVEFKKIFLSWERF